MRVRLFLAFAAVGTMGAGSFVACGGDSATDAGAPDTSVVDTSIADTSVPDTSDATPPCPIQGNLQDLLKFDAAGVDAAGVNLQVCFDCITGPSDAGGCKANIDQCNADCECKTGVVNFAGCVAKGGKVQTCGASLILGLSPSASGIATGLLACAQSNCASQCGVGNPKDAATGG